MSFQVPQFIDPETGEDLPNAVLKMTAGRFHNSGGKFGFDGIEVSVYRDLAASKTRPSRLRMDASSLLALAPPTVDAQGNAVPPQTVLDDAALGRIKVAMLNALYKEYANLGVFAEATEV